MRRLSAFAGLAGVVAAAALLASPGGRSSRAVLPSRGAAPGWRGLVGSARPQVALGQRVLVVLRSPSLAARVAAAGGFASDVEERRWTAQALAAQQQFLTD